MRNVLNSKTTSERRKNILRKAITASPLIAAFTIVPFFAQESILLNVLIMCGLYALLGGAWNILGGLCGQISFGQALYFGVGSYVSTILFITLNLSPWLGMLIGGVVAAMVSIVIGTLTFRLGGAYFILSTIVVNLFVLTWFSNWNFVGATTGLWLKRGQYSLSNFQFASKIPFFYIIWGLVVLQLLAYYKIKNSKQGYYMRAVRENEEAAKSLGINTLKTKLLGASLSAFFCAIGGSFYAQYTGYIDPTTTLAFLFSVEIALVAIVGGIDSTVGPLIGALVLISISELSRIFFGSQGAGIHLIIYSLIMIGMITFAPGGIASSLQKILKKLKKNDAS